MNEDGVTLNGVRTTLSSKRGRAFLMDFGRAVEKKLTIAALKTKYELTNEALKSYLSDETFITAVAAERVPSGRHDQVPCSW